MSRDCTHSYPCCMLPAYPVPVCCGPCARALTVWQQQQHWQAASSSTAVCGSSSTRNIRDAYAYYMYVLSMHIQCGLPTMIFVLVGKKTDRSIDLDTAVRRLTSNLDRTRRVHARIRVYICGCIRVECTDNGRHSFSPDDDDDEATCALPPCLLIPSSA